MISNNQHVMRATDSRPMLSLQYGSANLYRRKTDISGETAGRSLLGAMDL